MSWLFRVAFGLGLAIALVLCLIGILLTGPVLVRVSPLVTGISASPERLRRDVHVLCTELGPRSPHRPDRLDAAAEWIASEMSGTDAEVELQDYTVAGRSFRNVIARRPGSDANEGAVVFGAHYDAYGDHPGANDNASGVAVLLELLRTLPPDRPHRRTQIFAAFSTEQPPYFGTEAMGSHVFAEKLADEGTKVGIMVALDVLGSFSAEPSRQPFLLRGIGLFYPKRGNFVAIVGDLRSGKAISRVKQAMLSVNSIDVHSFRASPSWAPVHLSDHWSFRRQGIPAVQVTDASFLHSTQDPMTADLPEQLDYTRMARVVEALHGLLWE